jgi:hypothetical protein
VDYCDSSWNDEQQKVGGGCELEFSYFGEKLKTLSLYLGEFATQINPTQKQE